MHAKQGVVLLAGDDLHEPVSLARDLPAPQDAERERADANIETPFPGLMLGQPDTADLRIAIRARGHMIVVERAALSSGNAFGGEDAFGRREVRQLRVSGRAERDHVADGGNPRNIRSVLRVDLDVAVVELQTHALGVEPLGDGTAASCHQ